ncbi:hypothetical protein [Ornithinibacillus bavariensis]|uniref:hypothetical protein n=1 Tax=Ornithinibacillus bavariensis TaxID=545502 RepID=UPI003D19624C
MTKTTYIVTALLVLFIFVLSTVNYQSEDRVIKEAGEAAQTIFSNEDIPEENFQGSYFSFYLPKDMEATEADANNAVLQHGDQMFIVFYNPLETKKSDLNFNAAQNKEAILLESFKDEEKFGYIRILPEKKDYELQVGVGGVKVTTYTEKSEIIEDAERIMKIALSIVK